MSPLSKFDKVLAYMRLTSRNISYHAWATRNAGTPVVQLHWPAGGGGDKHLMSEWRCLERSWSWSGHVAVESDIRYRNWLTF